MSEDTVRPAAGESAAKPSPRAALKEPASFEEAVARLEKLVARMESGAEDLDADGWLLIEHGYDQAVQVRSLLVAAGFADVASWRDLADIERVSGGRWMVGGAAKA